MEAPADALLASPTGPLVETPSEPPLEGPAGRPDGYVPALTGLRGVAVLLVIGFHTGQDRGGPLPGGWAGVDVFFVLSGFLVTGLLLAPTTASPEDTYRRFLVRRAARLLPALVPFLLAVALVAVVAPAWLDRTAGGSAPALPAGPGGTLLVTVGVSLLGVLNLVRAHGVEVTPALGHLWSLDVEWQFYLVWPLAVLLLGRSTRRIAAALLVAASVGYATVRVGGRADWAAGYFGSVPQLAALGAGAVVALLPARRSTRQVPVGLRPLCGLALLAIALRLGDGDVKYRWGVAVTALPTALLVWSYARAGARSTLLEHPAAQWLGDRSYGLYLWHLPLLCAVAHQPAPVRIGSVVVSLLLADLSLRFVELPARRRVHRRQLG